SRRPHTRFSRDWSSDVCSSDLKLPRNVDVFWAAKTSRVSRNLTEEPRLKLYFLNVGRNRTPRLDGEAIVRASQSLDEKAQPAVRSEERRVGKGSRGRWRARQ